MNEIVGEKEIAARLAVQPGTVHQWMLRRLLPDPDGYVSGSPAWNWDTISRWAWDTGRTPAARQGVLHVLSEAPGGAAFATPLTAELIRRRLVGPETSAVKVASILTDLLEDGLVQIEMRNLWRITPQGRSSL